MDGLIKTALDIRNEARKKILQTGTRINALEYADVRKEVKTERNRTMRKISFKNF
jgi:hypothetical protein